MIKKLILLFILFPVIGFSQNINSKAGDWYFYHPKTFKADTSNFKHFNSGLTVLCDTVETKGKSNSIKLFPTLREIWDNSICESYSCYGKTKPSILGNQLFFKNDSLQLRFDSSEFTIDLAISNNDSSIIFNSDSLTLKITLDSFKFQNKFNTQDSIYYFSLHSEGSIDSTKLVLYRNIKLVYGLKLGFLETPDFYKILHGPFSLEQDQYWLGFANNPRIGGWDIYKEFFFDFDIGDEFYFGRSSGPYPLRTQEFQKFSTKDTSDIDSLKYSFFKYTRGDTFDPDIRPFPTSYWQGSAFLNIERKDTVAMPYSRVWVPNYISKRGIDFTFPVKTMYYVNERYCISTLSDPFFSSKEDLFTSNFFSFEISVVVRDIFCQGLGHVYKKFWHETWNIYSFVLIDYKKGSEVLTGLANEINLEPKPESVISPNPASDYFKIGLKEKVSLVEIFNEKGQRLKVFNHSSSSNYSISDIPSGIYFVKIHTSDNEFTEKLIIE